MTLSLCKVYQPFNWATKILEVLELVIFIEALLLQLVDKSFSLIAINCALQCGWAQRLFLPQQKWWKGRGKAHQIGGCVSSSGVAGFQFQVAHPTLLFEKVQAAAAPSGGAGTFAGTAE